MEISLMLLPEIIKLTNYIIIIKMQCKKKIKRMVAELEELVLIVVKKAI